MTARPRRQRSRRPSRRRPRAAPRRRSTIDAGEIANFAAVSRAWWDPDGEFRPLHRLNPVRLTFDAVLALEVIEHSADPALFLATATSLVAPGGAFALSTLSRTLRSFLV